MGSPGKCPRRWGWSARQLAPPLARLVPLLDQFVCVRVINANTIDLSLFQYDYDLSFSAIMFNGDGTIYGRYGSWLHQKDPLNKTTASFKKALEATLDWLVHFLAPTGVVVIWADLVRPISLG